MNLLLLILSLIVIVANGFQFHGLEGCDSTEVPRTLIDGKVGTQFYSFKLDEKNGFSVGEDESGEKYVKIPRHKHLYGWYYRSHSAFEKEDVGIVDWFWGDSVLNLPGFTVEFGAAENLMSIYQEGFYTEEELEKSIKKAEEIKEKFGDKPYDFVTENDLERKTKLNEHFMGTNLISQLALSFIDYGQVMKLKAMPQNVPDNDLYRKILKEKAPHNTMENSGDFNKTSTNCLHLTGEIEDGKRIVTLMDDGYLKVMLNQKMIGMKGDVMYAPAFILNSAYGPVYFQINEEANTLEITGEWCAGTQMKTDEIPIKPKFVMGLPHTENDNRINFISKESTAPFCHLPNEIAEMNIDYRYLWAPHDEICPSEMQEDILNGFLPKFIVGNPETFPTGEKFTELMQNWAKLSYCSTDYFVSWIKYGSTYCDVLSPIVFIHFILEMEAGSEIEMAMDQRWSNFWNMDYVYGQEEESISIVHGNYGGPNHCRPGRECWNGEGPCTSDVDCRPSLYCHKRSQTDDGDLPGYDFTHVDKDLDLCVSTKKGDGDNQGVQDIYDYQLWQFASFREGGVSSQSSSSNGNVNNQWKLAGVVFCAISAFAAYKFRNSKQRNGVNYVLVEEEI